MSVYGELRHTLTVDDVGVALADAGVPRSRRQIIRYCQTGLLDAVKVPGPTGDQWYASPASLPKAICDLKQWEAQRERHSATRRAMSDSDQTMSHSVMPEKSFDTNSDAARQGSPQHAMTDVASSQKMGETKPNEARHTETESATAGYVAQLEKRIEEKDDFIGLLKGQLLAKDEQISELSTRYRETHTLLGAMQRMFAPLLGQSDPYVATDKRETEPKP